LFELGLCRLELFDGNDGNEGKAAEPDARQNNVRQQVHKEAKSEEHRSVGEQNVKQQEARNS
jgi:hypothetical protein